jgi:competence protein ComEA
MKAVNENGGIALEEARAFLRRALPEADLMTLPGIGASKAKLIVEYRTEHGNFASPEDIKQIPGIKDGVYNRIKDSIITK